jgi:hypothetical protein
MYLFILMIHNWRDLNISSPHKRELLVDVKNVF